MANAMNDRPARIVAAWSDGSGHYAASIGLGLLILDAPDVVYTYRMVRADGIGPVHFDGYLLSTGHDALDIYPGYPFALVMVEDLPALASQPTDAVMAVYLDGRAYWLILERTSPKPEGE